MAAILTSSRGALAVALAAAAIWDGARVFEAPGSPHLTFWPFWLVAAVLAVAWDARVARHLAALSAIGWWIAAGLGTIDLRGVEDPGLAIAAGGILTAGTGMLIAAGPLAAQWPRALRAMGATLSLYGAFALGLALPAVVMAGVVRGHGHEVDLPGWIVVSAAAGTVLALAAVAAARSAGPALIGLACGLALVIVAGLAPAAGSQPFPAYALSLIAALCLVVSGLVDDIRPRTVAGWMAVAGLIAAITWAVEGSLLARSLFLGVAGAVAVALALLLGRLTPREERA
jgi:hypothetical protein